MSAVRGSVRDDGFFGFDGAGIWGLDDGDRSELLCLDLAFHDGVGRHESMFQPLATRP